jgi:hypothetical protein
VKIGLGYHGAIVQQSEHNSFEFLIELRVRGILFSPCAIETSVKHLILFALLGNFGYHSANL